MVRIFAMKLVLKMSFRTLVRAMETLMIRIGRRKNYLRKWMQWHLGNQVIKIIINQYICISEQFKNSNLF